MWKLTKDRRYLVDWPYKIERRPNGDYTLILTPFDPHAVQRQWVGRFYSLKEAKRCAQWLREGKDIKQETWQGVIEAKPYFAAWKKKHVS